MKNLEILKAKGAIIKDNGTMADLSKKLSLFVDEMNDEQIVNLNKLVKQRQVDIIILPAGSLENFEEIINQALNISNSSNDNPDMGGDNPVLDNIYGVD